MLRLLIALFISLFLLGQDFSAVNRYLDAQRSKSKIPGYAAAIYAQGAPRWTRAAGLADRKANRPVRRDTPFRIASLTKTLTAVAVLQQVEMGLLNLEDEIQSHCPAFPAKAFPIKLVQLLGHLGGIRHYRQNDPADVNNTVHYKSVSDALRKFSADPLLHPPDTKFLYSSYGFNLLGCAIEGASGMPYPDWMTNKVFATVGMCNTVPDNNRGLSLQRAQGYRKNSAGQIEDCLYVDNTVKLPGGGYVSTVDDLLRFVEGLYRQRLIRSELMDLMWTSGRTKMGRSTGYGLGWSLGRAPEGDREIYHTGNQQGTSSILYLRPEHHFAFVWLTNLERVENRLAIARQIYRLSTKAKSLSR